MSVDKIHKYTVLYIEDTPANLRLVSQVLAQRSDILMLEALEAEAGLKLVEEHHPDLILLDLGLPGKNGYQVLAELREKESTRDIPVFAISANAMQADIQMGLDAGFDKYIPKPFKIKELLEIIVQALEKRS